jgi:hypothetical protein
VLADGGQISTLARGPRPDLPTGLNDHRRHVGARIGPAHALQEATHVLGRHHALGLGMRTNRLDDLGRLNYRFLFSLNMDVAVSRRDTDPQRIADLSEVLIAGPKDS